MEKLNVCGVTLEGYAQGGWRTSIHVPEVGAIFDAGTMLPMSSVDKYFITHGHPDHIGALGGIVNRRTIQERKQPMDIYCPAGIAQGIQMILDGLNFCYSGGGPRRSTNAVIHPMKAGDETVIRKGKLLVRAMKTYHGVPSCGWAVEQTTAKLKAEFQGMAGRDIGDLRKKGVEVTDAHKSIMLVIPGDTRIDFLLKEEQARKAKVLVHEVTYWDDQSTAAKCRRYGHVHVDDMIEHCEKFEGEALVLCHRSMKHTREDCEKVLKKRFPSSMLPKIHLFDGGDRVSQRR